MILRPLDPLLQAHRDCEFCPNEADTCSEPLSALLSDWYLGSRSKWSFLLPATSLQTHTGWPDACPRAGFGCLTSKQSNAPIWPSRAWCLGMACRRTQNGAKSPAPFPRPTELQHPYPQAPGQNWGPLACSPAPLPPGWKNGHFPQPPLWAADHTPVTAPAVPSGPKLFNLLLL